MECTVYHDGTVKEYRVTLTPRKNLPWIYIPIITTSSYSSAQGMAQLLNGTTNFLRKQGF